MTGKDVFVITRTGSGKTFCYQGPAMADLDGIVLVLCGLINLQEDQVRAAKKNGIKAVALNESTLSSMPRLVDQVSGGDYEVVLMSPEFCTASNHNWCKMTGSTEFSRRLKGIVVDEAHLIHSWRDFRPAYTNIHQLRVWYPSVPFMVLTATMTPYVRVFVHKSLRLNDGTAMIHRKVDRPEIYLATQTIQHGLSTFQDLDFLLPGIDTLNGPGDIIPTIVYADNRSTVCKMANSFWNRVPNDWQTKFPFTFCDLSTGLSTERRRLVVAATQRGFCRILFATQVAEVGIDFPRIERVIQWCIPQTLSAAGLYQRFGRAARTDGVVGVGILFHTQHAVIPVNKPDHPLQCLQDSAKTGDVPGILRLIQAFDSGSHRKDQVATTALECAADISLQEDDIQHEADQSEKASEVPEGDQDPDTLASRDDSDIAGDCLNESLCDDSTDPSSGSQTTRQYAKLPSLCRMLMWMVNTNGCIREALMRYFDEAQFSSSAYTPSHYFPCCDRHTPYEDLSASFRRLLPVPPDQLEATNELHEFTLPDSDFDTEEIPAASQRKQKPLDHPQKTAVVHALQTLRADVWKELQLGGLYSPFSSYTLISDEDIRILSTKAPYILDAPDTASNTVPALRRLVGIGVTNILPRFLDAMQLAVDSTPVLPKRPRGRPIISDTEFTLPHDIPSDADPEDPDVLMLLQENDRAQREHDVVELSRQRSRAWQHGLRHPPPLHIETRLRGQQLSQPAHHSLHDSDLDSSSPGPACDLPTAPAFHPPTEQDSPNHHRHSHSSRFQNDPQDERTLDPRILACLPKRGKGRPSAADKASRTRLIEQLIREFAVGEASVVGTVI
jgi:superfamily II DNA/RNA helicase